MARKASDLQLCMITQQFETEYFSGWTDEELKAIEDGNLHEILNIVANKLIAQKMIPLEIHGIIHDKDYREVWDNVSCTYITELKPKHFHILIKFATIDGKLYSGTLEKIAAAVGVEPAYIERAKKGKFAYDNMLAYLIHIKHSDKTLYSVDEVISAGMSEKETGKPLYRAYADIYAERKRDWEEGRAKVTADRARVDIDILEEKILLGELTKNQVLLTDNLYEIYARNKRRCEDAFDTYAQHKIAQTIRAMENGEFRVSVFFVTGRSHSGKSYFTDSLVKSLIEYSKKEYGHAWSVCSCAATNPFDEYSGDEILVMDDLRGMALSASDWLKLLDPDRINTGSARYRNRKIACRTIIINSEKDVLDFFFYLKGGGDKSEAMDQFIRRIMARVVVYRVPDSEERLISIGEMKETGAYELNSPAGDRTLTLHHDFDIDETTKNMNAADAISYLVDIVSRNNRKDG